MKILVTGAKGQLGYDVCRELTARGYTEVWGIDRDELDLTDEQAVNRVIMEYRPAVIIHNAAWTDVDKAETMPDACRQINVLGTQYLTACARQLDAKLVYISTDYVFDGQGEQPFAVADVKIPLSVYGKTKYEGELSVAEWEKHFIVRTSWVFGINGNNFVKTMLKLAKTKTELNVVSDQIGSPTYTADLAKFLCELIITEKYGIYHATNEGFCSWAEFAKEIFALADVATVRVNPVTTAEYHRLMPKQAPRPLNSRLSKDCLIAAGFSHLPVWQDALARYLAEIRREK